ncbi:hypothetical protein [Fuchsiella alkaliacetigena]|uniref:hypothetical protein n=1 Tax=Fuchsiella alkaliacetigena TaxID=957042 RepID=UPI00200B682D|nr:hypothetical protein [Fuchsiella alkaliacetigena]MCK8824292.1 hypothetical protein [Fuchsiella alkaliacetigena]
MLKNKAILIVVIVILFTFNYSAGAREAPFSIEADDLVLNQSGELIIASGKVRVEFDDLVLLADELEIDLVKEEVLAIGEVSYIEDGLELTGSKLIYNYGQEQGEFLESGGRVEDLQVSSDRIEMVSEDDFKLERAMVTSCIEDKPHHKFVARQATIYPGEMLVARNVEFWLGDYHLLTYPSYRVMLEEGVVVTPIPTFGYGSEEGAYVRMDYNHYVNPNLMGELSYQWNSKASDRIVLDYDYQMRENIRLNPIFVHNPDDDNDDDDDLKERDIKKQDWYGRLIFNGDFDYNLSMDSDLKYISDRELIGDLQLTQTKDQFYWQLDYEHNLNWNYQPHFSLGVTEHELANTGLLGRAEYSHSKLQFRKSEEEIAQQELELGVKHDYSLTDSTNLSSQADFNRARYETDSEDLEHDLYSLAFDLDQQLPAVADIHLGWQHVGESGDTPSVFADFDDLTESKADQTSWRRYYDLNLTGHSLTIGGSGAFNWGLKGQRATYATEDVYDAYGYQLGYQQGLGSRTDLALNYEYLTEEGQTPLSDDEIDKKDHLEAALSYSGTSLSLGGSLEYHLAESEYTTAKAEIGYRTNSGEWPYWSVDASAEYDFEDEEYDEQLVEVKRVYDCMDFGANWDFVEQRGEISLQLKY